MQPLAVDPRILRTLLTPDIKIVPGRAIMARVAVADGTGRGSLSIAGFIVEAELPKDVRSGQDLRLVVREVTEQRVVLSLSGEPAPAAAAAAQPNTAGLPVAVPIPLPGGGTVQVTERDARGGSQQDAPADQTLALRYDAPVLGPVDLRFALDPATLQLSISVTPGRALELARGDLDGLRTSLAEQLGRSVSVTVGPRRTPLDVYA
jgi:hypothetical protein